MKKRTLLLLLWIAFAGASCKKIMNAETLPAKGSATLLSTDPVFTSDHDKNLTVVYFVPSDNDTIPGYRTRLGAILLQGQKFYGDQMQARGYGFKTFGLLRDTVAKQVKIIVINGSLPKASYPYTGGSAAAAAEINAYRTTHPSDFTSDHVLVIMPAATYDANGEPGGVPFYGTGRWDYALDYADLDIKYLGQSTTLGNRATKWIGGMFHEMGHGLNLPHNKELVSQKNDPNFGTALMGAGNYTYGKSPTFLTAADCAILNANQIFQTSSSITYYTPVAASIQRIFASYNSASGDITVSGRFQTNTTVTNVAYYLDPNVNNEGVGTNKDYNANSWKSNVIGTDSFYVQIPIAEMQVKGTTPYELKVKLIHENGTISQTTYNFDFINNVPVFNIINEYPKTGWVVIAQSTQETNYPASNLIDGSNSTYWRSKYTSAPVGVLPHSFRVDMSSLRLIHGFTLKQRSDTLKMVKDFRVEFSTDNTTYTPAGTFVAPNNAIKGIYNLSTPVNARYFRLVVTSNYDGTNDSAIAEVGTY
ncbi:discoidin domain-containing protein [Pedobacter nutrimenti]|uniref:discoidin domain-containing protein n=1 Tax=Pedobacter nutrimenti TaxID=1241337 RepID=UPI00292DB709|nr:discoidin domain-containing protein [Pedobacter nutrimenti]